MTSAAKTNDGRASGFTLLEVIIVLAVAAMVMGGGIAALHFSSDGPVLHGASEEIEVLAKRARTIATLRQQPYALEITAAGVSLMPYAEAMIAPNARKMFLEDRAIQIEMAVADGMMADAPRQPVRDSWAAGDDMRLQIRRWASPDWIELKRDDRHVWRFDPNGICEPVGLRIEMENSWLMMRFHPLTAAIADIETEIQ